MLDEPLLGPHGEYFGRPAISPVIATLIAMGEIKRNHRILVPGCGHGTDARQLAKWGFRHILAVDLDKAAIAEATKRSKDDNTSSRVEFRVRDATRAPFDERRSYDAVLDTFLYNNMGRKKEAYVTACARLLKPGGLLVIQEKGYVDGVGKIDNKLESDAAREYFELRAAPSTLIAEYPLYWNDDAPHPWACAYVTIARRNTVFVR